jgi:hypothetical protein
VEKETAALAIITKGKGVGNSAYDLKGGGQNGQGRYFKRVEVGGY